MTTTKLFNWALWKRGLAVTVASAGMVTAVNDTTTSARDWYTILNAIITGIISGLAYLKTHPADRDRP